LLRRAIGAQKLAVQGADARRMCASPKPERQLSPQRSLLSASVSFPLPPVLTPPGPALLETHCFERRISGLGGAQTQQHYLQSGGQWTSVTIQQYAPCHLTALERASGHAHTDCTPCTAMQLTAAKS